MKKINLILLLLAVISTSCNDKKKTEEAAAEEKPFTVVMNVTIKQDDVTCLYYKDNTIGYFSEEMGIYKNLTKSDAPQDIIFELPEGFVPNDFRLDLSHQNPNQTMTVNKITFKNPEGKSFEILNKDLDKYFTPNEGVVFNEADRSFTFKNGKNGGYDPFLSSTGQFYPLLETLVGAKAFAQTPQ